MNAEFWTPTKKKKSVLTVTYCYDISGEVYYCRGRSYDSFFNSGHILHKLCHIFNYEYTV
jgi:hypothetical protein